MNEVFPIILECITTVVVLIIIPFVGYCVINITTLKTDVKWIIEGMKLSGDKSGHVLHSPHSKEFDGLIEQFWHGTITREGAKDLAQRLDRIIHEEPDNPIWEGHPYSEFQKAAAKDMLTAVTTICKVPAISDGRAVAKTDKTT